MVLPLEMTKREAMPRFLRGESVALRLVVIPNTYRSILDGLNFLNITKISSLGTYNTLPRFKHTELSYFQVIAC